MTIPRIERIAPSEIFSVRAVEVSHGVAHIGEPLNDLQIIVVYVETNDIECPGIKILLTETNRFCTSSQV